MDRIERTLDLIAQYPHMGRTGRRANTREVIVPRLPILIVYGTTGDAVEVLTVFHTAQDPDQI